MFPEKTRELSIDVEVIADMTVINPFDYFIEESAEHCPFDYTFRWPAHRNLPAPRRSTA